MDLSAPRLKTALRVQAAVRLGDQWLVPVLVERRGDAEAGALLVKMLPGDGTAWVLSETRDGWGRLCWTPATDPVPEAEADRLLQRLLKVDPDAWIVTVEDRAGRNPFAALA